MLINASNISKAFAGTPVLDRVTLQVNRGDRIGLVGENGTGKTTFLNILAGTLAPDDGSVTRKRGLRVGYVEQLADVPPDRTVYEVVRAADERIVKLEARLTELETAGAEDPAELDRLLSDYEQLGGYRYEARVDQILRGLGMDRLRDRLAGELSGGEYRRMLLARVFAMDADVLLLDEPTNHLDVYAVQWLEDWLKELDAAFVLVSHDRYILDAAINRTLLFTGKQALTFSGGYSRAMDELALMTEQARKKFEQEKRFRNKEMEFIRRNIAGQKTRQAQSRLKQLEKMEWTERDLVRFRSFGLNFAETGRRNKEILAVEQVAIGYDKPVVSGISRLFRRGDRVAVVGRNGSGKSTLLKTIAGRLQPMAGAVRVPEGVVIGYLDQDIELPVPGGTVADQVLAVDGLLRQEELLNWLARFYFFGDDVDKPVSALSGGERSRLKMAVQMRIPVDMLVLDEPTNHLDMQLKEALIAALKQFSGTLLVVSHDRWFLDQVATEVMAIEASHVDAWPGTVSEYLHRRRATDATGTPAETGTPRPEPRAEAVSPPSKPTISKNERMRAEKRLVEVEDIIAGLEAEQADHVRELENPAVYRDADRVQWLQARLKEIEARLAELMTEWERLQGICM